VSFSEKWFGDRDPMPTPSSQKLEIEMKDVIRGMLKDWDKLSKKQKEKALEEAKSKIDKL
jgi:hypothetical protein